MPLYFRKRPGSKNIKANVTQRGLRSLTFTTGSKKRQPRLNYNTSRGWSFSFPGTGIMWRKGYGNSKYKSVVENAVMTCVPKKDEHSTKKMQRTQLLQLRV